MDLILDIGQESDFLVKSIKIWLLGLNSSKDFVGHPFEGLILFFLAISIDSDVLLLSWVNTGAQELLEVFLKSFFPEELFVLILINEIICGLNDVVELVGNILHGAEKLELILDLDQVVSTVGVQSWHLD